MADELIDGQWQPGQWSGHDQLTCVRCKWDTLEGIEAAREFKAKCPRCAPAVAAPPSPRVVFVADRWGNPVEEPDSVVNEELEEI